MFDIFTSCTISHGVELWFFSKLIFKKEDKKDKILLTSPRMLHLESAADVVKAKTVVYLQFVFILKCVSFFECAKD